MHRIDLSSTAKIAVQARHMLAERDTPWLVQLLYAFQHVYLAMEYVPGGDFSITLAF